MGITMNVVGSEEVEVMDDGSLFIELEDGVCVFLGPEDTPDVSAIVDEILARYNQLKEMIIGHAIELDEMHGTTSWSGIHGSKCDGIRLHG